MSGSCTDKYIKIKEQILFLEKTLLRPDVRQSPEVIRNLLSDDFSEFCSSGKIYNYSVGDTFYEDGVYFEIIEFDLLELSDECVLAKYKVRKEYIGEDNHMYSLRSSVWKCISGQWKMVFHQGTLIK